MSLPQRRKLAVRLSIDQAVFVGAKEPAAALDIFSFHTCSALRLRSKQCRRVCASEKEQRGRDTETNGALFLALAAIPFGGLLFGSHLVSPLRVLPLPGGTESN